MPTTPNWQAARNGLPGNRDAVNASAQVNQLLGTHVTTSIYGGNQIVTPGGTTNFEFVYPGVYYDFDQPFTMPAGQTSISRVTIPVLPVGSGADLVVTLCPDSAGAPQTSNPLASTVIPAAWITALAAPDGITAGGPLATAHTNTLVVDNPQTYSWGIPAISGNGAGEYANVVTSGNYVIFMGGFDNVNAVSSPTVVSVPYLGGTQLGALTAQPPLPEGMAYGMAAATSSALMYAGGYPGSSTTLTTDVWVATWTPDTGTVGAWSKQTALPQTWELAGCAAWGNNVYIVSGAITGGQTSTLTNEVIYATITNGQLGAWQTTAAPYPQAVIVPVVAAINGWLIGCGGQDATNTVRSEMYYAKIHPDGSLGAWMQGPSMPVGIRAGNSNWSYTATDSALIIVGGETNASGGLSSTTQILTVSADGPSSSWQQQTYPQTINEQVCAFPAGGGTWQLFTIGSNAYISSTVHPMPVISVPLPAVGLVAGSTYHVVLQQGSGGDSAGSNRGNDYLGIGLQVGALPTAMLSRIRGTTTWSTFAAGWAVPMGVYGTSGTGRLEHTWADGGRATSTLVNSAVTGALLGVCEATLLPNSARNSNNLTTSSVSPWTASGGTITASSAQTQGGYAYSGLLTPSGTQATSWAQSELMPVTQGQYYVASGWLYSTPGYGSVSLSVMWWDHAGNFISSSNATLALAAATWTEVANEFQAPTGAAQAALAPSEGGTPTGSDTLYMSAVTLTAALPGSLPSVAAVTYSGVWPPVGVTQLA